MAGKTKDMSKIKQLLLLKKDNVEVPIATLLQPLIIHCESFLDIFMQPLSSPTAEAHGNGSLLH